MIKTIDIIGKLDLIERTKYSQMLKQVNIPDFYKCISQFTGLKMNEISDEVMIRYLITWAKNKYKFWKMLDETTQLDMKISYRKERNDFASKYLDIQKKYPIYAGWIDKFKNFRENRIQLYGSGLSYETRVLLENLFPNIVLMDMKITHLFKKYLQAPESLVAEIAGLYEHNSIDATFTISIDPVDIMLSSDNPYGWNSCYRLELDREDSHADGCMAAVLDTASLVTYIWNNHGKFKLYDKFEFKDIRYKMMRMTIAINDNFTAIHFNKLYPNDRSDEFNALLRDKIETIVANYTKVENKWKNRYPHYSGLERTYLYGYSEYDESKVYSLSSLLNQDDTSKIEYFSIFDTPIECACGCGNNLIGSSEYSDDGCEFGYNGYGFTYENMYKNEYCDLADEYCNCGGDICEWNCSECWAWQREHPICELTTISDYPASMQECTHEGISEPEIDDGTAYSCHGTCAGCPLWEKHHALKEDEDDYPKEEKEEENKIYAEAG